MRLSDRGLEALCRFEGFSNRIYKDSAGLDTIGYGHLLTDEDKRSGRFRKGITEEQARWLLSEDVGIAERAVDRAVTVPLTQSQFDALVSWTYNVGVGALRGSTLLRRLNSGDYGCVPSELLRWCKAGGRQVAGLVKRRQAEGRMWGGTYDRPRSLVQVPQFDPWALVFGFLGLGVVGIAVWYFVR